MSEDGLNAGQRAILMADKWPVGRRGHPTEKKAAKEGRVSLTYLTYARRVLRDDPALAEKVRRGDLSLADANDEVQRRHARPRRPRPIKSIDVEWAQVQAAEQTRAAFAYDMLERLARCPYEPMTVAASIPANQHFRIDTHLKLALGWLTEFHTIWTANDSDPAQPIQSHSGAALNKEHSNG